MIPQDMRSVMADMEVVEAKEKVEKNKKETLEGDKTPEHREKVATDDVNKGGKEGKKNKKETLEEGRDDVNNKSGKIKRRGKKKSSVGEEEMKVDQKGGNPAKTSSQEATDTAIVKRMVRKTLMKTKTNTNTNTNTNTAERPQTQRL